VADFSLPCFAFFYSFPVIPPTKALVPSAPLTAHGWLSIAEFTDLITISQMTPGPIAVNSSTFVGLKNAGS